MRIRACPLTLALAMAIGCASAFAQNVKITPLGSHAGELCSRDRATLFEDPTGVRILYDAGQSVTGADDSRLGAVHVVLLSHAHGDHIGDQTLVYEFHKANLMVLNLGPSAVTSYAGAYAVNELVRPAAVIASHVNEGATTGGKVRPSSRTAAFISMVKGRPVYPALSGKTMEFDGDARCVSGC